MENESRHLEAWSEKVDGEMYEDLLNRYERILVYAGQLQEKARQGRLLEDRANSLQKENERLKSEVGVDEAYVRFLERALEALGVLKPQRPAWRDEQAPDASGEEG